MKKNIFNLKTIILIALFGSFIACENDFSNLESDVLNTDVATNFDILNSNYDVITYNNPLGPVQTNNGLGLSTLGLYDDSFGRVESDFVAQLTLSSYAPDFGEVVEVDSVVLNLPFFSTVTEVDEDGNITYESDSIFGSEPIKLSIFRNNYFIRDFDPNNDFSDEQAYFSNKSASASETISDASLEGTEIAILPNPDPQTNKHISLDENGNVIISNEGFILTAEEDEETVSTRQIPGIRLKLDTQFWKENILDQQDINPSVLSNENSFLEYFRGLYFRSESVNDDGSFLILNTSSTSATVTIYYKKITESTTDDPDEIEQESFEMRFAGNRINFLENSFNTTIPNGDPNAGDERLYLKGGQGAISRIKLFNGDDINDGDDSTFDDWKSFFVETDDEGNFENIKRIVNEANLVFYVDQNIINGAEPERLYIYDLDNKTPLTDFFVDLTNTSLPLFSKFNHLGRLQRVDDEPTGDGIKYKFRITEHINNLLLRDSTNVELGLSVSLNVNLEELAQQKVQTNDDTELTIPISSVLTPRGTVLHGNSTEDESKRVYLEIYYTEPNN